MIKNLPAKQETQIQSRGQEDLETQDPLEKGMAAHSSILAWRLPWTEKSGGLQSMGSQRVGHDWATNTVTFSYHIKGFPRGHSDKESVCQCRRRRTRGFDPWVQKIPWRRKWQPTPAFLPGESHGQRSLGGYSPWGLQESDTSKVT